MRLLKLKAKLKPLALPPPGVIFHLTGNHKRLLADLFKALDKPLDLVVEKLSTRWEIFHNANHHCF